MSSNKGLETIGEEAFSILSQFFEYDLDVPLDVKVYDQEDNETSSRVKIVFHGLCEGRVPAYLALPAAISPPYPLIFLLHGLGSNKEDWWTESTYKYQLASELLDAGYAVCTLDIPFHGERAYQSDYESVWSVMVVHSRGHRYREMLVESVLDHRRAIDYLTTRPDIASKRIGIFGGSVGGLVTYILTALDTRIKVAVAASTLPMHDFYFNYLGWDKSAKDQLAPVAPRNFAPSIKQAAFLQLNGKQDPYGTIEELQYLHDLIGSPTKKLILFDSGHVLPPEFVPRAVEWFRQHLE